MSRRGGGDGPLAAGFATGRLAAHARPGTPDRRQWILVAMALAFTMTMIDATIVSVALPTIQRDLGMSNTARVWIVDAYLLVYTVSIAAAGRFADRLGQRRVFLIGLWIFILSSLVAGLSRHSGLLIAARAAEGLGGALMTPTSQAMVVNAFPEQERGRALGRYAGVAALGVAAGPLLGGALTSFLDWYWIFFVNIPVGVLTLVLTRYANPPQSRAPTTPAVDWMGLGLLIGGLTAIVIAVMQSHDWGLGSPAFLGTAAGGVLAMGVFGWHETRTAEPLLRLRIFTGRDFLSDNLVTFCTRFALFGMSVYAPLYVQEVLGFSAFLAGASTLPATVVLAVAAPRFGKLYDRVGARPLLAWGSLVAAVGYGWLAAVLQMQSYVWLIPGYVVAGLGISMLTSPALTDAMNAAPAEQRGEAAGLLGTVQQLGATIGTAVITALLVPLFVSRLTAKVGEPTAEVQRVLADSQGGTRPTPVAPEIIAVAKEAFSWSLAVAFGVVVAILCLSLLAGFGLHTRTRPAAPAGPTVSE